jgi:hypothetical protein
MMGDKLALTLGLLNFRIRKPRPHQLIRPLYNIESSSSHLRDANGPEGLECLDASSQNIPEYRRISPMYFRCKQKSGTFPDNSLH